MAQEDVNNPAESSDAEDELEQQDDATEDSESGSDKPAGDKSDKTIPYSRFKEVNDAKKTAEGVVNWYRQNIGDPEDVQAFHKWKQEQMKKADKAEDEGSISAKKLAEIRKVMRQADPEYVAMLERQKAEQEARSEAQFDEAEEIVRELAEKEYGLKSKSDEADISWLAKQTMLAIKDDEKLQRLWTAGSTERCIKRAFKAIQERQEKLGKSIAKLRQEATDKRKVSRLPTLPSASGTLTGKSQGQREKGLGKQADADAWAVFQQRIAE